MSLAYDPADEADPRDFERRNASRPPTDLIAMGAAAVHPATGRTGLGVKNERTGERALCMECKALTIPDEDWRCPVCGHLMFFAAIVKICDKCGLRFMAFRTGWEKKSPGCECTFTPELQKKLNLLRLDRAFREGQDDAKERLARERREEAKDAKRAAAEKKKRDAQRAAEGGYDE